MKLMAVILKSVTELFCDACSNIKIITGFTNNPSTNIPQTAKIESIKYLN